MRSRLFLAAGLCCDTVTSCVPNGVVRVAVRRLLLAVHHTGSYLGPLPCVPREAAILFSELGLPVPEERCTRCAPSRGLYFGSFLLLFSFTLD